MTFTKFFTPLLIRRLSALPVSYSPCNVILIRAPVTAGYQRIRLTLPKSSFFVRGVTSHSNQCAEQNLAIKNKDYELQKELFLPSTPELTKKAHLISDFKADTQHFLSCDSPATHAPETAVTAPVKEALQFQEEARHTLPHPVWSPEELAGVEITHIQPTLIIDRLAYVAVKTLRTGFDIISGYALGRVDERGWLNRIVFLETVAGVPGMVGAMVRHLRSLRKMERDYGWIHTLLEEAENERMHLMTALVLKKPTFFFRSSVLLTQALFLMTFSLSYILSARFAHRFVGYLEEEAVITYSKLIKEIDIGHLPLFESLPAPPVARDYWCLADDAVFRDVVLAIRADESHHREVNHTFAEMSKNSLNPFPPGH